MPQRRSREPMVLSLALGSQARTSAITSISLERREPRADVLPQLIRHLGAQVQQGPEYAVLKAGVRLDSGGFTAVCPADGGAEFADPLSLDVA
jgi:hypothetical protein